MHPAIKYLLSIESKGIKLGLKRTKALSKQCSDPHKNLQIIQVAGTNGKGSTSAMIANILFKAKYDVGLFTSPHLLNINERIRVNGIPIENNDIAEYINLYQQNIEKISASFFETLTIMAFWYFKKKNVDYAIMETGLGGRLDSVSICKPIISVITSISNDHSEILGNTLSEITKEKTGIIKYGVPCITIQHSYNIEKIIKSECSKKKSPLIISDDLKALFYTPALKGDVQLENAHLAQVVINSLPIQINNKDIKAGIEKIKWPGRNQIIQKRPLVVFDVAHNEAGIFSFIIFFKSVASGRKKLIFSIQSRKKIKSQINLLNETFDEIIICETANKRTMKIKELKKKFPNSNKITCIKSDYDAIQYVINNSEKTDSIGIIGTHYFGYAISEIFNISFNLL